MIDIDKLFELEPFDAILEPLDIDLHPIVDNLEPLTLDDATLSLLENMRHREETAGDPY